MLSDRPSDNFAYEQNNTPVPITQENSAVTSTTAARSSFLGNCLRNRASSAIVPGAAGQSESASVALN
jgi:hypothetical protein